MNCSPDPCMTSMVGTMTAAMCRDAIRELHSDPLPQNIRIASCVCLSRWSCAWLCVAVKPTCRSRLGDPPAAVGQLTAASNLHAQFERPV